MKALCLVLFDKKKEGGETISAAANKQKRNHSCKASFANLLLSEVEYKMMLQSARWLERSKFIYQDFKEEEEGKGGG